MWLPVKYPYGIGNTFFIAGEYERGKIMDYASLVLARSKAKYCIAGWLEFLGGDYSVEMDLIEKV